MAKKRDLSGWDFTKENTKDLEMDEIDEELEKADYVIKIGFFNNEGIEKIFFVKNIKPETFMTYLKISIKHFKKMVDDLKWLQNQDKKKKGIDPH